MLTKLEFILDREVEPVTAPADQIIEAINRHYNQGEIGDLSNGMIEFTDTAIDFSEMDQAGPTGASG
jgi:type IV pilus assembly protein PilB